MTRKHLNILIFTFIMLFALVYVSEEEPIQNARLERTTLLHDVAMGKVTRVKIESGENAVTLVANAQGWGVADRHDYRADRAKINSMFLKVFDLAPNQVIPSDKNSNQVLGLDDQSISKGSVKVSLFSDAGAIAAIYLGLNRVVEDAGAKNPISEQGQYLRRDGDNAIYLISQPLYLDAEIKSWLDVTVANVLNSRIVAVKRLKLANDQAPKLFELRRQQITNNSSPLILVDKNTAIDDVTSSQLISGLENFRLSDVYLTSSEVVAKLSFDERVEYLIENGLIYQVDTGSFEGDNFAKIAVRFDSDWAAELEAAFKETGAVGPSDENPQAAQPGQPIQKNEVPHLKLSNEGEAAENNVAYQQWVFRIEAFQANKLRMTEKELEKTNPSAGG